MQKPDGTLITGWGVNGTDSLMPLIAWLSAVMPNIERLSSIALPYLFAPYSRG
jgi:hypothetical protein